MNTKRYIAAGAVSLLVHSMFLAATPTKDPVMLTMGTDTPRVSLTFVSTALPITPTPTITPVPSMVSETKNKPVVSNLKRLAKTENTPHKTVNKKTHTSVKKIAKPIKPIKKTPAITKKKHVTPNKLNPKKSPTVITKNTNIQKSTTNITKVISNQSIKQSTTPTENAGTQALQLVSKPTFATRPGPVNYPRLAKRRGIEGQVLIEIWIDAKGQQLKQKLIKSSGAHILDKAALDAIKKWHFSSHLVNGKAIAHRVQIPVRFKLD